MIIKGASRRSIRFWARHLTDDLCNDRVDLIERRGLIAEDLSGMMREMRLDSTLTATRNFMYIASFNPCPHEKPTERQWERMLEIFEKHRRIPSGQQRIVYQHHKKGRIHRHAIWSRIDLERLRAFPDAFDFRVCKAAQEEIERELGMEQSKSHSRRTSSETAGPKSWEMFRGQRSLIDPRSVTAEITSIFQSSAAPIEFLERIRALGYEPCHGDRRLCVLDRAGDTHSLARRIDGINTKQLKEFLQALDIELPTLEAARDRFRNRHALATAELQSVLVLPPEQLCLTPSIAPQLETDIEEGAPPVVGPILNAGPELLPQEVQSSLDAIQVLEPPTASIDLPGAEFVGHDPKIAQLCPAPIPAAPAIEHTEQRLSLLGQFKSMMRRICWPRQNATPSPPRRRSGNFSDGFAATARKMFRRMADRMADSFDTLYWCYFCNSPDPTVLNQIHAHDNQHTPFPPIQM